MVVSVALDPGDYTGSYKLIGGAAPLDFANLVSYRDTARHHDWLQPADNLERWVDAAGVAAATVENADEIHEFRELLARLFLAVADDEVPTPVDVDRIGALAAVAGGRRRLRFPDEADAAVWVATAPSLIHELALDTVAILTSPETLRRLSACEECRWVFIDSTRNHSRRWCDPADCGNRARQRRHYRRTRRGSDSS